MTLQHDIKCYIINIYTNDPMQVGGEQGNSTAYLGTAADTAIVTAEGNTLALDHNILQVLGGFANVHAFDGLSSLTRVLGGKRKKKTRQAKGGKQTISIPQEKAAAQSVFSSFHYESKGVLSSHHSSWSTRTQ